MTHDRPAAPAAPKQPRRVEQLGRVRVDDYAWLKDENWRAVMRDPAALRPDIRAHLEEENAYTADMLSGTEALQAELFAEMRGRIKEDDSGLPSPDGPFDYYVRFAAGAQHPVYARRPRSNAPLPDGAAPVDEQVLVDAETLAAGKPFFSIAEAEHSPDHALYAYAVDEQGSEYYRIEVKDLSTGELLPDPVTNSTGAFAFSPDSQWLFWTERDENGRPARIHRRPARGRQEGGGADTLVYDEPDEGMFLSLGLSASRAFIVIGSGDHETSEVRLISASDPTAEPRLVEPRTVGLRYSVEHWPAPEWSSEDLYILTNADGAVDYKIMSTSVDHPERKWWTDWVAHEPGRFIVAQAAVRDWHLRLERVNANNQIVATYREDVADYQQVQHTVGFDEDAYALSFETGYEWDSEHIRFVYQSPTTPRSWFDYDLRTRQRTLLKVQAIPSGHDPASYVARRLYARAEDGAEVPITVLMKRDTPLDGSAPLLLYGYGAYGLPMEPSFSIRNLSLVDRGWIWATAHIRGGTEKGWNWFLQGRKENKPNTFTDFVACAEHLAQTGYGRAGRMVAYGGSAGGMLMGAVANLRPDLWAGIIAAVPFVDVLNTMSDASLPLTPPEWPEWGNPLEDAQAYDLINGYSPYDNVRDQAYPAVLATGGLSDSRVTYWEPAKWVAKLREHQTGEAPILLKINMEAGHGGASGRFDFLKEIALDYAFAIRAMQGGWAQLRES